MISLTHCSSCGWKHASFAKHACKYTTWKRLVYDAKHYLIRNYGLEDVDILDACIELDRVVSLILKEEREG